MDWNWRAEFEKSRKMTESKCVRLINFGTGEVKEVNKITGSTVRLMLGLLKWDYLVWKEWRNTNMKFDFINSVKFESTDAKLTEWLNNEIKRRYEKLTREGI